MWEGRWNFNAIVVGLPGDGKTTITAKKIVRHIRETPGLVLAHDPRAQFVKLGCTWFADVAAYRRAAADAVKAKRPMPRACSIGGNDGDAIMKLALEIGERLNTADHVARPVLVPLDETADRESHMMTPTDKLFLTQRRHAGVGGIFNVQDPALVEQKFYRLSTDVVLFQLPSDRARDLDRKLYLEVGTLEAAGVCRLGLHEYVHVRPRIGIVREEL